MHKVCYLREYLPLFQNTWSMPNIREFSDMHFLDRIGFEQGKYSIRIQNLE